MPEIDRWKETTDAQKTELTGNAGEGNRSIKERGRVKEGEGKSDL